MSLSFFKNGMHQTIIPILVLRRDEYRNTVCFNNVLLNKSFVIKDFCKCSRSLSQLHRKQNNITTGNKHKDYTDLAIRNFIKGLFSTPPKYNLINDFKNYSEIVDFIKDYKRNARISRHSVYKLKSRRIVIKSVPRTKETELFIEYVKTRYKNFDDNAFFDLNKRIDLNNSSDKILTIDVDQNKVLPLSTNYTLKRFCTNVIIFLTPSLIFLMLIGYYDYNESSINLNNMITQHNDDCGLVSNIKEITSNQQEITSNQQDDCGLVSNIKEITSNQQDSNNSSCTDTFTSPCETSGSRTDTNGLTISLTVGITMGLICLIGLVVFTYTIYPQGGNDLLEVDSKMLLQQLEYVEGEGGDFMLKKLSRLSDGPLNELMVDKAEGLLMDIAVAESKHPKSQLCEGPFTLDILNRIGKVLYDISKIARGKSV